MHTRQRAGRAVVTGTGALSSAGRGVDALWQRLYDGTGEPDRLTVHGIDVPAYRLPAGIEVPAAPYRAGRATAYAIDVAGQALAQAGLPAGARRRAGLVVATTLGDLGDAERPFDVAGNVADELGLGGPNHTISTACSAGVYAVSWAAQAIAAGDADVVVIVGVDALHPVAAAALERFGLLDHERCRPFDADRGGMVSGEGAAALVVEAAAHAGDRGAEIHARVGGDGWSCDAHHPTAPEPDGTQLGRAIRSALAGSPQRPDAALLHRAGIRMNDEVEAVALAATLGADGPVPAYAIKAVIGHTAGAAGVFACLAAVLMLSHHRIPPNVPTRVPDPSCLIATDGLAEIRPDSLLVSASGFGGNNAALILAAA